MSEAYHRHAVRAGKGVKGGRFHFDGQYPLGTRRLNSIGCLAERGISCPAWTNEGSQPSLFQSICRMCHELRVGLSKILW